MQNLHARNAITLQSRLYFATMLGEQIFENNNGDTTCKIKDPAQ